MADRDPGLEGSTGVEVDDDFDRLFGIIADGVVGAAGGLVGTALLTGALVIAGSFGAFSFGSFETLVRPLGLSSLLSVPATTLGYVVFLGNGMLPWPLLFASVKPYLPGGRDPVRGMVFGTILWTGFVGAFYDGFTGLTLAAYLGFSLVGHWAYGFGVGAVFEYLSTRPNTLV